MDRQVRQFQLRSVQIHTKLRAAEFNLLNLLCPTELLIKLPFLDGARIFELRIALVCKSIRFSEHVLCRRELDFMQIT